MVRADRALLQRDRAADDVGRTRPSVGPVDRGAPASSSRRQLASTAAVSSAKIGSPGVHRNGSLFIARSPTKASPLSSSTVINDVAVQARVQFALGVDSPVAVADREVREQLESPIAIAARPQGGNCPAVRALLQRSGRLERQLPYSEVQRHGLMLEELG